MPGRRTAVAVVALLLLSGTSSLAATASSGGAAVGCRGTRPNHVVVPEAGFGRAGFNFGSERLRAHLNWRDGHLRAGTLPDGGSIAVVKEDGSISTKQGWWRGSAGRLVVTGRRLDAPAPPLRAHVPVGYAVSGFVPVRLVFPTTGCWRVSGKLGSARIAYVVRITTTGR